ncbi:MAG TPA: condensation domain-containing protein, partial [Ktedonobacteraceae bacterium]|nr:condensation domain-containing protein [Ktedonobacteraceae bacterium]
MMEQVQGFRLSSQQKRLWLLQQQLPGEHHIQCAIRITGDLDVERLKNSLQLIIERHTIFRTTFQHLQGMRFPVQVIRSNSSYIWHYHDLSSYSHQEQVAEAKRLAKEETHTIKHLEQGPLFSSLLIKFSSRDHLLCICLPALCADTTTIINLLEEIDHSYHTDGLEDQAEEDIIQYVQFTEWQKELLESDDALAGKAYWEARYSQEYTGLKLPFEYDPVQSTEIEHHTISCSMDKDVLSKVEYVVQKYDISIDVFFLTCWLTLLWKLSGETSLSIGYRADGRKYEELHNAMGLFARCIPIHYRFEKGQHFYEVLQQLSQMVRGGYEWQEYFAEDDDPASSENPPDFPLIYELTRLPAHHDAAHTSFLFQKIETPGEPCKLKLSCMLSPDELTANFHYDPHRFSPDDIYRLKERFQTCVINAVTYPEIFIDALEIMSVSERERILSASHSTRIQYETLLTHELFERQVKHSPDSIAVEIGDHQLLYSQLNRRANQFAHYLKKLGVGPDVLVAVHLEPSLEIIEILLGILKAGGAYVPLAPELPLERLAFILEDTQASIIVSQQSLAERLPRCPSQVI